MDGETPTPFESWAVVEIFGHQKYAGFVTQLVLGSQIMWRIDVPSCVVDDNHTHPFTKIFGVSAVFSITPCSEEIVRRLIQSWQVQAKPLHVYSLNEPSYREEEEIEDGGAHETEGFAP